MLSDSVLDCVEEGIFQREVYEELVFPIYFRTLGELLAPIEADSWLAKTFRVEKAETREVSVPFNVALNDNGDKVTWARSYTGFLRAFSESILASALPADLPLAETLDKIYYRVEHRLIANPASYEFHYISIAALLTRI